MNASVWIKAIIGVFVTLGTTLITLFTGPDVKAFGDISQVQYAVAIIGAVLAGLGVLQASLSDSPSTKAAKQEIVTAAANLDIKQAGFARLDCMWLVLILCAAMAACATTTLTPGKSIGAVSVVIERLALQIDQAQKAGQITNAREDELLDQLKAINGDLRLAYTLAGPNQLQSLEQIDARLTALRAELAKEKSQ